VDETTIRLWDLPLYHWRLRSSRPEAIPCTSKFRDKVNICGGISFKGATDFKVRNFYFKLSNKKIFVKLNAINKVFKENMSSELYQEIVLESFFPFMAAAYNFDCTLHQDNDPKHKSKLLRNLFIENNIDWVCFLSKICKEIILNLF
jgi:hypothetical protein